MNRINIVISGKRGIGKTRVARWLAASLKYVMHLDVRLVEEGEHADVPEQVPTDLVERPLDANKTEVCIIVRQER